MSQSTPEGSNPTPEEVLGIFHTPDLKAAFAQMVGELVKDEVAPVEEKPAVRPIGFIDGNLRGFDDWANY